MAYFWGASSAKCQNGGCDSQNDQPLPQGMEQANAKMVEPGRDDGRFHKSSCAVEEGSVYDDYRKDGMEGRFRSTIIVVVEGLRIILVRGVLLTLAKVTVQMSSCFSSR
jgi:hypothetical protein